jgi:hypothetical protein
MLKKLLHFFTPVNPKSVRGIRQQSPSSTSWHWKAATLVLSKFLPFLRPQLMPPFFLKYLYTFFWQLRVLTFTWWNTFFSCIFLGFHVVSSYVACTVCRRSVAEPIVLVFMNIVLWLKSWYVAEKPVFPPKYSRGGIHTSHPKKWKQTWLMFSKAGIESWSTQLTELPWY